VRVLGRLKTKRDRNEPAIMDALRKVGAWVMQFDKPADLHVGYRGKWSWLEVKDGAAKPSARKLTDDEVAFQKACQIQGLPYFVVETVDQALKAIGATT
jgi:hypothetical protein